MWVFVPGQTMNTTDSTTRHSGALIAMHWLMAVLLVATAITMEVRGLYPKGSGARELIKTAHYVLGMVVFGLVWVRLFIRATGTSPQITPQLPAWQTMLGHWVHILLYVLMVGLPLLGWLALSAKGKPVPLLWGLQLPMLIAENRDTAHLLKEIHEIGARTGYGVLALHAGAALLHHYVFRDNTLLRMLPGKR